MRTQLIELNSRSVVTVVSPVTKLSRVTVYKLHPGHATGFSHSILPARSLQRNGDNNVVRQPRNA